MARADALVDAQEMEAAAGTHRLAHPARLEREGRALEIVLHLAAAEGAELPALAGPRAFRELPRESAEIVPIQSERPHLERLGPRVRHRGFVGRVLDGEEDVAHLDALDGRVVAEVGVVVTADLLGGDVHVLADLAVHERRLLELALDARAVALEAEPLRRQRGPEALPVHPVALLDLLDVAVDLVHAGGDALRLDLLLEQPVGDEGVEHLRVGRTLGGVLLRVAPELVRRDRLAVDGGDDAVGDLRARRARQQNREDERRHAHAAGHRAAAYHAAESLCKCARSSAIMPS